MVIAYPETIAMASRVAIITAFFTGSLQALVRFHLPKKEI